MPAFKKGSTVRQIVPTIVGEVSSTRFNEEAQELEYHVDYKDAGGHPHSRWFFEHEIEAHGVNHHRDHVESASAADASSTDVGTASTATTKKGR